MDNVKPLNSNVVVQGQPDPDVVTMLEKLLARAKSGDIVACAVANVDTNVTTYTDWAGSQYIMTLAGGIAYLQHRYLKAVESDDD